MADKVTKEQLENLEEAEWLDREDFNKLLKEYTGITAEERPYYVYFNSAGEYIGDSGDDVMRLLKSAYVEVVNDG
jgi:hypothetical protein